MGVDCPAERLAPFARCCRAISNLRGDGTAADGHRSIEMLRFGRTNARGMACFGDLRIGAMHVPAGEIVQQADQQRFVARCDGQQSAGQIEPGQTRR